MMASDIIKLLQGLSADLSDSNTGDSAPVLPQTISPALLTQLRANIKTSKTDPVVKQKKPTILPGQAGFKYHENTSVLPKTNQLLEHGPTIIEGLRSNLKNVEPTQISKGAGILHNINPALVNPSLNGWFKNFFFEEFISVYLASDTTHPVLLLPVDVSIFEVLGGSASYEIAAGSVWILSALFDSSAPANNYTGLTVSGGTLSFTANQHISNKSITITAGAYCSLLLDLQQPVDSTVSPDNIGIDAMNSGVKLPGQFSFSFSAPTGTEITGIAQGSWNLYGSPNTFTYNPSLPVTYNSVLNSIMIPFTVAGPQFVVNECQSPFFTIQGQADIWLGYWELPVAQIDITQTNTATGTGALAVICKPGLQVNWTGLKGGWATLRLPMLSAAPGIIGVVDAFAGDLYGSQVFNLWANTNPKFSSTLNINYGNLFALYYLSIQEGEELLTASAAFSANIDRPVRVDGSPVALQGTDALIFQVYTPASKWFFLMDFELLAQNYPTQQEYPQEAVALTNALLTITPAMLTMLYGKLGTPNTFTSASLYIGFGLYSLLPALPDPYASTYSFPNIDRYINSERANDIQSTQDTQLPLGLVKDLLVCRVKWPVPLNTTPQLPKVAFIIVPLDPAATAFLASQSAQAIAPTNDSLAKITDTAVIHGNGDDFTAFQLAMLDVSTNADLMGVSFSTMNIDVRVDGDRYSVKPVNNAGEADFLQIIGMDLSSPGKFVRAFTLPEISWEPVSNLTAPANKSGEPDPPFGFLLFPNDGGPTQIFNNSDTPVSIAPIPVTNAIINEYNDPAAPPDLVTASVFTLPFGMRSAALFVKNLKKPAGYVPPQLSIVSEDFDVTPTNVKNAPNKIVSGGLQVTAEGQQDPSYSSSPSFPGLTMQLKNVFDQYGNATGSSILGGSVDQIFNGQFADLGFQSRGVPLERIDFSGYGASTFSNWLDPNATIAATSQAKFDVFVGRTSLEIIQVKSIVYPWAIRVVRTITMYRAGSAVVYRTDSGWRAQTDGVYDFSYSDEAGTLIPNPYEIHPGVVKGVFNVTNIIENDLPVFTANWHRAFPGQYIDPLSQVLSPVPNNSTYEKVTLQPVYFDADVQIDNIVQGGNSAKRAPSKKMLGYVQLAPRGELISPQLFADLLATQNGALGGPVNCLVNFGNKQQMRLNTVEVGSSLDATGTNPVFAGTALGAMILPKDGSWSIVQHKRADDSVTALTNNASIPLIRRGVLKADLSSDYPGEKLRLANAIDLLKDPDNSTIDLGLLQNTGTQKVLFQTPAYLTGVEKLLSKDFDYPVARFADAFHLLNSVSAFPNVGDVPAMDMATKTINLVEKGMQLFKTNPNDILKQALPSPFYFVDKEDIKLSISYDSPTGNNLNYDLDSTADSWLNSVKSIQLNVYLKPFIDPNNPLVYIKGNFDSQDGSDSAFNKPDLKFGPDLQPVVDILQVLESLSTGDYAAVAAKALSIAMGNGGDNFEYKFHADKEIATIQFPPAELDGPTTPLRLTAGLKVGCYFNESLSITSDPSSLLPSAGAYFEFDGGMQVMCVSLAAATIYAVGQVVVRISADTKTGPALYLKFGFGVELMVGLPVVGDVSVTYMVGIEMDLTTTELKITAFLLFKGEADLLGGLVDITITIEASGTVDKRIGGANGSTSLTAEVTFAIDISIFLVINIDFSKSWSETRQIA